MRLLASLDLTAAWPLVWPALAVALLRIADVSIGVFRTVFVVQERRLLAALSAGVESATWLAAAGIVFADVTPVRTAGFVVGVAGGTAIGVELTRRLRLGMVTVRIYTDATRTDEHGAPLQIGDAVARAVHDAGFGATIFRGRGYRGPVDMVLSTVRRRHAETVVGIARRIDPEAFTAVDSSPVPAAGRQTVARV